MFILKDSQNFAINYVDETHETIETNRNVFYRHDRNNRQDSKRTIQTIETKRLK